MTAFEKLSFGNGKDRAVFLRSGVKACYLFLLAQLTARQPKHKTRHIQQTCALQPSERERLHLHTCYPAAPPCTSQVTPPCTFRQIMIQRSSWWQDTKLPQPHRQKIQMRRQTNVTMFPGYLLEIRLLTAVSLHVVFANKCLET